MKITLRINGENDVVYTMPGEIDRIFANDHTWIFSDGCACITLQAAQRYGDDQWEIHITMTSDRPVVLSEQ